MKYEVSNCILDYLFDFSSITVSASNKTEALKQYIEYLKWHLGDLADSAIEDIVDKADDCIYEPIISRLKQESK